MSGIFDTNADLKIDFSVYKQDLLARFRSRLLFQFQNSPILDQLTQCFAGEINDAYQSLLDLLEYRTLAEATGVQLDVIGDLVGQERININGASKVWFTPDSNNFDSANMWCYPASLYEDTIANDIEYRRLIIAKIFRNQIQSASIPELRYFVQLATGEKVSFQQAGNLDLYLVVKSNIPSNILAELTMIFPDNKKYGQRYFIPVSATTRILGVLFLPLDSINNCIGFRPDNEDGRPDYAKWAVASPL